MSAPTIGEIIARLFEWKGLLDEVAYWRPDEGLSGEPSDEYFLTAIRDRLSAPPPSRPSVTMEWFNRFKDAVLYQEGTDEPKGIFLPVAKEMLRAIGVKVEEK